MTTTGYTDAFARTVSGGLGTATSGQVYTVSGTASQYSVAPGTASLAQTGAGGLLTGLVDLQSGIYVDISGQVALSAIPASNLATVGFMSRAATFNNGYMGTLMVATGGAMSIRFSKLVAGGLVTLSTVALGTTYVAGTFYNLRFLAYWSRSLQVNVLQAKVWAVGAAQPGGWSATSATDSSFTDYTGGTQAGVYSRDESTVAGVVVARFQNVASVSYNLPMPATTDTMCADPAIAYPKQTALQSLAVAADATMATIDSQTALAGLFPRVRVSTSQVSINTATSNFLAITYGATEYNVNTPTDLGFNNKSIYLPVGIWLVTFEIELAEAASNSIQLSSFGGSPVGQFDVYMRSNAAQANDQGVGGCGHASGLMYSTDPTTPITVGVSFIATNSATTYTVVYAALSAIKISDYFT